MDWFSISSQAVGYLIPFLTKLGESLSAKLGEQIFELLKNKFKGNKEASNALSSFAKNPIRYRDALIDIIREQAEKDVNFGEKLWQLVKIGDTKGNQSISQTAKGKNINQIQAIGDNIQINKK